jgi:hypothetical protein
MTIKEAILLSLKDLNDPSTYKIIYNNLVEKGYYSFSDAAKTPDQTVSAQLGEFIRKGDTRVKRTNSKAGFLYYLTENEDKIDIQPLEDSQSQVKTKKETYLERDLHPLLSSYLKSKKIFSKTIFHEKSNGNESHQKWVHPDMIGIKLLNLSTKQSNDLMKITNKNDTFKITSYEIKREINSDYELKKCYFQAVSNSTWSNYGFLVAYNFDSSLYEEMERLNQSFGIGMIELSNLPYESKILFPSKYNELDFKTIDKLCKINEDFRNFIEYTEKILTADDKYFDQTLQSFSQFCDPVFDNDTQIIEYCREKNIPEKENEGSVKYFL